MPDVEEGQVPATPAAPEGWLSPEDVEKIRREALQQARTEERDKLHAQLDKSTDRFKAMEAEVAELRKAEQARAKEADRIRNEAEKAKQAKEEAELSAKDLLAKRDQEFQGQLEAIRAEQAQALEVLRAEQAQKDALFAKEREFAALQLYITNQASAHANDIAPELIDLIDGSTKEEVDASVARLVEKTAAIVQGMRQAAQQQRAAMPGVSPGGGTAGIVPGLDTGQQTLSPEDIKGMSMKDFAKLREQTGLAARGQGVGIFG